MISGKTILIAHLGYPTEAFKAPMIYNPWFDSKGIDAVVVPMGVKPEDYAATLKQIFKFTNLRGALVTMPHKVTTVALIDEVTPTGRSPAPATRSCCVPTAACSAISSTAPASCAACSARASQVEGARVLVSGNGGVGCAIAASLAAAGVGGDGAVRRLRCVVAGARRAPARALSAAARRRPARTTRPATT